LRARYATARLLPVLLLLAACGAAGGTSPGALPTGLGGTEWRLVQFKGGDGHTLAPDERAKYTVAFHADGSVITQIDCNRGRGTWTSPEPGQLRLGPLALTRAQCPPGSLHDRIVTDWEFVRTYLVRDGHLFVSLMADAGVYELEPIR